MEEYRITPDKEFDSVIFNYISSNEQVSVFLKPETHSVFVEGSNMYVMNKENKLQVLTIDRPSDFIREGWIEKV